MTDEIQRKEFWESKTTKKIEKNNLPARTRTGVSAVTAPHTKPSILRAIFSPNERATLFFFCISKDFLFFSFQKKMKKNRKK